MFYSNPWQPTVSGPQFLLQSLENFPYIEFQTRQSIYMELELWYTGDQLIKFDTDTTTGRKVELYPLRINPLKTTVQKHVTTLFGESGGSVEATGLPFKINIKQKKNRNKQREKELEQILTQLLVDSNFGSALQVVAAESQWMGGAVFSVDWIPTLGKIQINTLRTKEFLGETFSRDYWSLKNCWIVRPISYDEAKSFGVDNGQNNVYWYTENWTKDNYIIRINKDVIRVDGHSLQGKNPFSVIPYVYIPHIRTTSFYGESLITDTVKGIIKEINLRMADIGDAISEDSHTLTYIRNVKGGVQVQKIGGTQTVYNLGSRQSIGTNDPEPSMGTLPKQSVSEPMLAFMDRLMNLYRREVFHPGVADGEDEGSQRSSLTLTTRMWPLVSHIKMERQNFSDGLKILLQTAMKMMIIKGINEISKEDLDINITISWSPMLSKDRDALINEIAIRREHKIGSQKHMIELLEDVEDVDEEIELINAEVDKENQQEMDMQKQIHPVMPSAQAAAKAKKPTPKDE